MKKGLLAALAGFLTLAMAQKFSVEAGAGFYGGFGGQLAVVAEDLAPGLPLGVRLGVGFATSDALDDGYDLGGGTTWGDVKEAGKFSEWGQNVTLSLDVLYKPSGLGLPVDRSPEAYAKLCAMRREYEPYLQGLGDALLLNIPGWLHPDDARDSWQTTAWDAGRHF